jgi:REP-associated tyrosine transposase
MPRRPRSAAPVTFFHVINRSARKVPLFARVHEYREFLAVLKEGLKRHPVRLLSYCVMSNHWHLVVGPAHPSQLSKLLHWVTTTHAVRLHLRRKTTGQGPVYQGRFKSHAIQAADELVRVCRYVERNALRARLVRRAQDWPWCSLSERLRAEARLPLVTAPFLESPVWVEYVNAVLTRRERLARPVPKRGRTVENRPVPQPVENFG